MIITFLYSLAGGMLVILATLRVQKTSWNFLRVAGFLTFGLMCLATVWSLARGVGNASASAWSIRLGMITASASFLLVFSAGLAGGRPGLVRAVCACGGLAGVTAAGVMVALAMHDQSASLVATNLAMCGQVLGALLLGSVTIAWLLAYARQAATHMTIAPLRRAGWILLLTVSLRLLFVVGAVAIPVFLRMTDGAPSRQSLLDIWPLLVLRVGAGLIVLGLVAVMVANHVRRNAIRSATRILFFGCVLTYAGELTAQHLMLRFGWPF